MPNKTKKVFKKPESFANTSLHPETKKTIDATDRSLGRVASEAAISLMGKDTVGFRKEKITGQPVEIVNASKLNFIGKKLQMKNYKRFSGYPSGLTEERMESLLKRKGYEEIIKKAVYGMLPKNKLRSRMIKSLTVKQ